MIYIALHYASHPHCNDLKSLAFSLPILNLQVFAQQSLMRVAQLPLNFMGPQVTVEGHPLAELLKDALHLYAHGEPIDPLVQYIGLTGLQHCGVCYVEHTDYQKQ